VYDRSRLKVWLSNDNFSFVEQQISLLVLPACVAAAVYTGTHHGVEVFAPDGTRLGSIKCGRVTNLAFVGSTLYCLSEKKIQAVKLNATGAKLP
jgi:hypothetical protein